MIMFGGIGDCSNVEGIRPDNDGFGNDVVESIIIDLDLRSIGREDVEDIRDCGSVEAK